MERIYLIDNYAISDTTPLFSDGLLDSFHLLELVTYIEEVADMRISPMEVTLHNLDSIEKIESFVARKLQK